MGSHWSDAELALVADQALSLAEVARRTGRSVAAVAHQASRLGVDRSFRAGSGLKRGDDNPWSDAELAVLADTRLSLSEVATRLGRTYGGTKRMASVRGIVRYPGWTKAELVLLADESVPLVDVAERTGKPLGSVYAEASQRGIRRGAQAGPQHYRWTGGPQDRRSYRGDDWTVVRGSVLERDGYTCREGGEFIPSGKGLVVHHLIPYRLRPVNDPRWLVTLCVQHHLRRPEHFWREIPEDVLLLLREGGGPE